MSDALRLEQIEYPFKKNWIVSYPWVNRPSPGPNRGRIIHIADVGGDGGSLWTATLAGWVPMNGRMALASNWGTLNSPISSITGVKSGVFAINGGGGSLIIPGGMLLPGRSRIQIEAFLLRLGTGGQNTWNIRLGSTGTVSDSAVYAIGSVPADNNRGTRAFVTVGFNDLTATSATYLAPGSSATGNAYTDVPIPALGDPITVSFLVASANTADTFRLVGYSVDLLSS
ncbi:hypothetical protein [Nitrosovibrio sp. Nv17]|uniref:hypothetical protein n=1 Tax=Nitrosovibrio sp. Nv17 TaxID=1855339 RepID=UPI0011609B1F|nr:hypothetical protein [Nitrosovibrio sp. Nv17]